MRNRILITSALPYINGVKHLGNLVGSLLPADVHALSPAVGDEVLFICGTDEHGTPAELGARATGQDVQAYCDAQHANQAAVYRDFGLSFDHFGRTSRPHNHALTQHFYRRLDAVGLIDERSVRQVWSLADRRFLPDRYVLGTCPRCGSDQARGFLLLAEHMVRQGLSADARRPAQRPVSPVPRSNYFAPQALNRPPGPPHQPAGSVACAAPSTRSPAQGRAPCRFDCFSRSLRSRRPAGCRSAMRWPRTGSRW